MPYINNGQKPLRIPQPLPSHDRQTPVNGLPNNFQQRYRHCATPSTSSIHSTTFPAAQSSTSSLPIYGNSMGTGSPLQVRRGVPFASLPPPSASTSTLPTRKPDLQRAQFNRMSYNELMDLAKRQQLELEAHRADFEERQSQQVQFYQSKNNMNIREETDRLKNVIRNDEQELQRQATARREVEGIRRQQEDQRSQLTGLENQYQSTDQFIKHKSQQVLTLKQQMEQLQHRRAQVANAALVQQRRVNGRTPVNMSASSTPVKGIIGKDDAIYGQIQKPIGMRPKAQVGPFQMQHPQLTQYAGIEKPPPPAYDQVDSIKRNQIQPQNSNSSLTRPYPLHNNHVHQQMHHQNSHNIQNLHPAPVHQNSHQNENPWVLRTPAVDAYIVRNDSLKATKRRSWAHVDYQTVQQAQQGPHTNLNNIRLPQAMKSLKPVENGSLKTIAEEQKKKKQSRTLASLFGRKKEEKKKPQVISIPPKPQEQQQHQAQSPLLSLRPQLIQQRHQYSHSPDPSPYSSHYASIDQKKVEPPQSSHLAQSSQSSQLAPIVQPENEDEEEIQNVPEQSNGNAERFEQFSQAVQASQLKQAFQQGKLYQLQPVHAKQLSSSSFHSQQNGYASIENPTNAYVQPVQPVQSVQATQKIYQPVVVQQVQPVQKEEEPKKIYFGMKQQEEVTVIQEEEKEFQEPEELVEEVEDRSSTVSPPEDPRTHHSDEENEAPLSTDENNVLEATKAIIQQMEEMNVVVDHQTRLEEEEEEDDLDLASEEEGVDIQPYHEVVMAEDTSSNDESVSTVDEYLFDEIARPQDLKGILKRPDATKKPKKKMIFDPLVIFLDAALEGQLDTIKEKAKQIPDISAGSEEGITALHNAICASHIDVIRYLIANHADVNAQDSDGWTPLHCAASCNNYPIAKMLIENGACVFAASVSDGETPAYKCEISIDGYNNCADFLRVVERSMGVINDKKIYSVYSFEAQNEDELSFEAGEELIVLEKDTGERNYSEYQQLLYGIHPQQRERLADSLWWMGQNKKGEQGLVPRNFFGLYPIHKYIDALNFKPFQIPINESAFATIVGDARRESVSTLDPMESVAQHEDDHNSQTSSSANSENDERESPPPLPKPIFEGVYQQASA